LKGSADCLLHWNLCRETNNQTRLAGFRFSSGMPYGIAIHGYRLHCSLGQTYPSSAQHVLGTSQRHNTFLWRVNGGVRDIPQYWSQATRRDSDHGLPPYERYSILFELFVSNPHVTNNTPEKGVFAGIDSPVATLYTLYCWTTVPSRPRWLWTCNTHNLHVTSIEHTTIFEILEAEIAYA